MNAHTVPGSGEGSLTGAAGPSRGAMEHLTRGAGTAALLLRSSPAHPQCPQHVTNVLTGQRRPSSAERTLSSSVTTILSSFSSSLPLSIPPFLP